MVSSSCTSLNVIGDLMSRKFVFISGKCHLLNTTQRSFFVVVVFRWVIIRAPSEKPAYKGVSSVLDLLEIM